MSSKPDHAAQTAADAHAEALGGGVVELSGADAGAFAQAQLMSDVRGLGDGQWQWSGWLTPKGRVIALGALLRLDSTRYWLVLADHPAATLADALRRYVFRSKVVVAARADLAVCGTLVAPGTLGSSARGADADSGAGCVLLDCGGANARTLLIGPAVDCSARLGAHSAPAATAAAWALEDLAHGWPRLGPHAVPAWTPQMLGLERLNAYSVRKGCYPGQEIVARTHFLGQAKRATQRLRAPAPLAVGSALHAQGRHIGDVVCSASDGTRHEAMTVLERDPSLTEVTSASVHGPIALEEFADGLAR